MSDGLLEPRLYRAAFLPALFALVVLMFSLQPRPAPVPPGPQPPPLSGAHVALVARQIEDRFGSRRAGSAGDARAAAFVARTFAANDFVVHSYRFHGTTVDGSKPLVNVVAVRPGLTDRRLVVMASRDGWPGKFSGNGAFETATLLELADDLQGRSLDDTIVLASVDGGMSGGVGADRLAGTLDGPVVAGLVLHNVAGGEAVRSPVLATTDERWAPSQRLVRTAEVAYATELRRGGANRSLIAQLVRMAFPVALGEQAPLVTHGRAAVSFSPGGEPLVPEGAAAAVTAGSAGRAALRTLLALDGRGVGAPTERPTLKLGNKQIPSWPLVLLIAALILPLIVIAVDSWARARRRRDAGVRGVAAPLVALAPLLAAAFALRGLGLVGVIHAPPLPPDPAVYGSVGTLVLGLVFGALALAGCVVVGRLSAHAAHTGGEAGLAIWLAVAALAGFAINPLAIALALPLLHVTMLMLLGAAAPRAGQVAAVLIVAATPLIVAAIYFPVAFGMGILQSIWLLTLLVAGGFISPLGLLVEALVVAGLVAAVGMVLGRRGSRDARSVALGPAFRHDPGRKL